MKLKYDDAKHSYWLDGKRCKGVTSVAKIPDDTYGLDQWRKREVVRGMVLDPALAVRAEAHFDERDKLNEIAEAAMTAAKSSEKADRGTALHRILERHDLGEEVLDTALSRAVRSAWDKALKEAKITIDPDYIERILVHPAQRVAGRMDRFVQIGRAKSHTVADLKTGSIKYPHSIAIQLALYANAPHIAGALDAQGYTEEFNDLPDMDRKWGIVIHMPTPEEISVVKVDIAAGWEIAKKAIFPIIDWRNNKDLVQPILSTQILDPNEPASNLEVAALAARLANIGAHGEQAQRLTASRWPFGIGTQPPWTRLEIETIGARLDTVERDAEVSF